ncbi:hypothetical protein [uncultured Paracoccus sp.]|uniref:portal protein n=1 Tax=uncultured Paracoccus sp. TaxID=189685 RepID=UPI00261D2A9A|nr:hypothetical protein [uncultured Paracoccus sp.]
MDFEPQPDAMPDDDRPAHTEAPSLQTIVVRLVRLAQMDDATGEFEDDKLGALGHLVSTEYQIDRSSRDDWETTARRAMKMAKQQKETKSHPWPGASNVKYPMLTTAALQFAARAYPAIVQGPRIVKCKVSGADPMGLKAAAADRVSQHMSYQLMCEMPEWEEDTDTLLHQIPIVGCAFRKVFYDPLSDAGCKSELVSAFDLVVNNSAKSLETVPRVSHVFPLYPHEVTERQRTGGFRDVDLKSESADQEDTSAPMMFIEQHRWWDSDGDGFAEPWIVTIHEASQKVVRLVANYDIETISLDMQRGRIAKLGKRKDVGFVKIPFIPDPEGAFYDIGFGKLLEAVSDVTDTALNQMMDAGSLQNAGGGFIGSGLKLGKTKIEVRPGRWHNVEASGPDVRAAIVPLNHPGPSPVLFQLLGMMVEAGREIAAVKDVLTGDTGKTMTATATMALIEQGLKVFTAIFKRVFRAMTKEFKLIFECNKRHFNGAKYIQLLDEPIEVSQFDYMGDMDVQPEADPNNVTDMQRLAKAQFLTEQVDKGVPFVDGFAAYKRAFEAMRIERLEEVLKQPDQGPSPIDELQIEAGKAEIEKNKATAVKTAAEAQGVMIQNGINMLTFPPIEFNQTMPMQGFGGMMPPDGGMPIDPAMMGGAELPMEPMAPMADPMAPVEPNYEQPQVIQ